MLNSVILSIILSLVAPSAYVHCIRVICNGYTMSACTWR